MTETQAAESSGIGAIIRGLIEELIGEDKTVIEVPFGNGFFNISSSTVTMWIIMAVLILICIILSANLKVYNISKRQAITESILLIFSTCSCVGGVPAYLTTAVLYCEPDPPNPLKLLI